MIESVSDYRLLTLRTDNVEEYLSDKFKSYLKDERIRHDSTIPKTAEQNSLAEQMNCILVETVRLMLIVSKLPRKF